MTDPIRRELRIPVPPDRAFEFFFAELPRWWPVEEYSVHRSGSRVEVEPGPEGTIVEVGPSGDRIEWARVVTWDPPARLVLAWHPTWPADTDLEVRFRADGRETIVEIDHRGWERLGDDGPATRAVYDEGWSYTLPLFEAAAAG